jgi:hypothetical protein
MPGNGMLTCAHRLGGERTNKAALGIVCNAATSVGHSVTRKGFAVCFLKGEKMALAGLGGCLLQLAAQRAQQHAAATAATVGGAG